MRASSSAGLVDAVEDDPELDPLHNLYAVLTGIVGHRGDLQTAEIRGAELPKIRYPDQVLAHARGLISRLVDDEGPGRRIDVLRHARLGREEPARDPVVPEPHHSA